MFVEVVQFCEGQLNLWKAGPPRRSESDSSDSDISIDLNKKDSDKTEMIAGVLEAKTAKQVLITQPNSGCVPAIRDLFCEEEEIVEDTDIGPGTYQGGKKEAKEIEKKKLNVKSTPHVHKTTRPARHILSTWS